MSFERNTDIAWCPGCGNFAIRTAVIELLGELEVDQDKILMVSGIGQAAKLPHYLNVSFFDGLHGRAIPVAFAAKAVNPQLVVIAESGDGDMYGEGGNHMIHAMRRNVDITVIVHDNQIYGLTKGQGSPTTELGMKTSVQHWGMPSEQMNPIALAIAMNASFVARSFSGNKDHLKRVVKEAIAHKGFSLVDVMQPCVTFNKHNTFAWYRSRLYDVKEEYSEYDPYDRVKAFERSLEWGDRIPMGILYRNSRPSFHELNPVLKSGLNLSQDERLADVMEDLKAFR